MQAWSSVCDETWLTAHPSLSVVHRFFRKTIKGYQVGNTKNYLMVTHSCGFARMVSAQWVDRFSSQLSAHGLRETTKHDLLQWAESQIWFWIELVWGILVAWSSQCCSTKLTWYFQSIQSLWRTWEFRISMKTVHSIALSAVSLSALERVTFQHKQGFWKKSTGESFKRWV